MCLGQKEIRLKIKSTLPSIKEHKALYCTLRQTHRKLDEEQATYKIHYKSNGINSDTKKLYRFIHSHNKQKDSLETRAVYS